MANKTNLFAAKVNGLYTEPGLVLPTLQLLQGNASGLTTSDLISELTEALKPTGRDIQILANRNDTHFSQKVRNLRSHQKLEKLGYATWSDGIWAITPEGVQFVEDNVEVTEILENQGFARKQIVATKVRDYTKIIIEEGETSYRLTRSRQRSDRLRRLAVEIYAQANGGHLPCSACNFDFSTFYGSSGEGIIEIHHLTPIATLPSWGKATPLGEMLNLVIPVCSNCHRIIHRDPKKMLSVEQVRELVVNNGSWQPPIRS